jgi:hypothetical protein
MAGRRIINEQDARRCLAAAEGTPGGAAAWARAHGVDARSLNCWRANLGRRAALKALAPRVVELVAAPAASVARAPFVLHVRGVEVDVDVDFEGRALARLLGVLKAW